MAFRQLKVNTSQLSQAYSLINVTQVPELALTAYELQHKRTGAKHLHLSRDDPNKTFSVQFRTTPMDSSGVAHILEHTVLCGSENFPVRDPFFKMISRSLSTFMNAFTASDWTMYPFSTLNEKDFFNLLSVYMDAAFKPLLSEMDFKQEGWRLEHENLNDPQSRLCIKGVVYNEMKGVFSSSTNVFAQKVENGLLPSHTYGIVSGGDPIAIPSLTWGQLRKFHEDHYHPSNARFYTYGDMELKNVLDFIDSRYLGNFERKSIESSVPVQSRWTEPKLQEFSCKPDPMAIDQNRQVTMAVSFMLDDLTDVYKSFVLSVVGRLLTEGDNAPLFVHLMESGLGSDFAPTHGYDSSTRSTTFHVGLQGVAPDDEDKVLKLIDETLQTVAREGFPPERIESLLHQIELSLKHEGSNFGLNLILSLSYPWNHDADASELLQINSMVDKLKKDLEENPQFLQNIVKDYFVKNPHKLTSIMRPDQQYDEKLKEEEDKLLSTKIEAVDEVRIAQIHDDGLKLLAIQSKEEDLQCLPCLQISDINPDGGMEPCSHMQVMQTPLQVNEWATNGVTYFKGFFDLSFLPTHLTPYIPLFGAVLPKLGAGGLSYREMSQAIELKTGGLSVHAHISQNPNDRGDPRIGLAVSSYCLDRNFGDSLSLWQRLLSEPDWSVRERVRTLIQMEAANLSSVMSSQGHRFAMMHAAVGLSPTAALNELWNGVEQLQFIKSIASSIEEKNEALDELIILLQEIGKEVFTLSNMRTSINTTSDNVDAVAKALEKFLPTFPDKSSKSAHILKAHENCVPRRTHIVMPFSVNYMGQAHKIGGFSSQEYATCRVLSKLLTWRYLHKQIREKGGAYGGGAAAKPGSFQFYSYRDPNFQPTLEAFSSSLRWISQNEISAQDLMEAKLSVFQEIDRPVPAGARGLEEFFSGITDALRKSHRTAVLGVTAGNVLECAERLLTQPESAVGQTGIGAANAETEGKKGWSVTKIE